MLGYYFQAASDTLDVTRASALVNDLGAAAANALSAAVPFDRLRDRLLPQLEGLEVRRLFPDFGALKLESLLPELTVPREAGEYGWVSVRHGFDKDRLTAWADVRIDKRFEETTPLFRLPPVDVSLVKPHFIATSRMDLGGDGRRSQQTRATLAADWQMRLSDKPIVTLRDAALKFDSEGHFDFAFDAEKIELAEELQFITRALRSLLPQEEGLTVTPVAPAGVRAELALPLPDLGTGAFTLTGITLYAHLDIIIADGFEVRVGFWLCKPERPFGLAILFLGGGGWVGVEARYRPPDRFTTRVSIGIAAGAFIALNLGVARGSAGILFTAGVDFYRDWSIGQGSTALSLGIIVWGELSILGIASASIRIVLRIEYRDGGMTGYGTLNVSIKICWCFTLRVSSSVRMPFKKPGGNAGALPAPAAPSLASGPATVSTLGVTPHVIASATVHEPYGAAPQPGVQAAVRLHFRCLDLG